MDTTVVLCFPALSLCIVTPVHKVQVPLLQITLLADLQLLQSQPVTQVRQS